MKLCNEDFMVMAGMCLCNEDFMVIAGMCLGKTLTVWSILTISMSIRFHIPGEDGTGPRSVSFILFYFSLHYFIFF